MRRLRPGLCPPQATAVHARGRALLCVCAGGARRMRGAGEAGPISEAAVQIPPGRERLGARVEHVLAKADGRLTDVLAEELRVSKARLAASASRPSLAVQVVVTFCCGACQAFVAELIRFGAVHWCPIPPITPAELQGGLAAEQSSNLKAARQAAAKPLNGHVSDNSI